MRDAWIGSRLATVVVLSTLGVGAVPGVTGAQALAPQQLLERAMVAAKNSDHLRTAEFLFAYIQADPPPMAEPGFAGKIREALRHAEDKVIRPSAGGGGRGDTAIVRIPSPPSRWPGQHVPQTDRIVPRRSHPESSRLVCRGGGEMSAAYSFGDGGFVLRIAFGKARTAAGTRQPGLGDCAWVNRPVGSSEPATLVYKSDEGQGIQGIRMRYAGREAKYPVLEIEEVRGTAIERLLTALARGFIFQVECYEDGRDLRVTEVLGKLPIPSGEAQRR